VPAKQTHYTPSVNIVKWLSERLFPRRLGEQGDDVSEETDWTQFPRILLPTFAVPHVEFR